MPWWTQILAYVLTGGLGVELLRAWAHRNNPVWKRLEDRDVEVRDLRAKNHVLRAANQTLMYGELLLKIEVNDLCDELGKPQRYDVKHPNGRGHR